MNTAPVPAADLATARTIIAAAEERDGASPVSDQAMLAVAQGQRELALFGDEAVAVGIVGDGEVDLVVHPEHRGRGIGSAALAELVARGSGSGGSGSLRAWSHGDNPAADAILAKAGFAPVRSLFRMALDPALLPSDGRDPLSLTPPAGFALRNCRSGDTTAAEDWVRVNAAAFADHPEQGRMTVTDFDLITQEDWFDPADLFILAGPEGVAAGSTWIKTTPDESELYAIGIHPDHAGHGLGRYLLDVTLARMAQHRPERVTLYVDGDNTRAVKMYEAAGFTIDSRSQQWERPAMSVASARMDA
ncbi:mycothiol synthase [Leucobacter viscericola]|uniref:Mycothiol synthase n=1 Tax=Leucobacter viscericola TaxID=2714935 RepID=A0A6G7XEA5_9MICO|nr:mycothiol synthase [Leucobacter viscericola]QIK62895.1 mycothiol synthase [Leucobacter viscericola]